jgi:hypothetical protein
MSRTRRLTATLAAVAGLIAILALPGAAAARDRNHDHIPDRWEKRHHLSTKVNQARRDQDHDHLRNRAEFEAGTNPRDPDTDDDGIPDGQEHAGTIQSFDLETGMLVIDLFGNGTVSGLVTEETEIECGGGEASASSSSGDGEGSEDDEGGSESSDDGQGDGEPGDDDGQENESGDDGQGGPGSNCTSADLEPGATVEEAELKVENGIAVFEEVEIAG